MIMILMINIVTYRMRIASSRSKIKYYIMLECHSPFFQNYHSILNYAAIKKTTKNSPNRLLHLPHGNEIYAPNVCPHQVWALMADSAPILLNFENCIKNPRTPTENQNSLNRLLGHPRGNICPK